MANTIYPNVEALMATYGAEIFAQALGKNYEPLFDVFPPVGARCVAIADFENTMLGKVVGLIPSNAPWLRGMLPSYMDIFSHIREESRHRELVLSLDKSNLIAKSCLGRLGNTGRGASYDEYLTKGAFIVDLFARKVGTSNFWQLGRCTARSGKDASALVNEAMRCSVTVDEPTYQRLGAPTAHGRDFRFSKIVMRLCGGMTTWLRKENSNLWTCKGALALEK